MMDQTLGNNILHANNRAMIPVIVVGFTMAASAAAATYFVLQLIQGGHLLSIPGIGVTPYDLTLYTAIGLYGLTGILVIPMAIMLENRRAHGMIRTSGCVKGINFIRRWVSNPTQVGALAASSKYLAKEITSKMADRSHLPATEPGMRFLEIGAGDGAFTGEMARKLGPNDTLDVVEIEPAFCKELRARFEEEGSKEHNPRVTIYQVSILEYVAESYDLIVSGLPLGIFGEEMAGKCLAKYEELAKEGAPVSYFEYIVLPDIRKSFLFGSAYTDYCGMLRKKGEFVANHRATQGYVFRNLPPARVQHCTIRKARTI